MVLSNSPAQIVKQLLLDLRLVSIPSYSTGGDYSGGIWPVFASGEPDIPDDCVTVYDGERIQDTRNMYGGEVFYHYGLRIRVRSQTHQLGHNKQYTIQQQLAQVLRRDVVVGANTYLIQCLANIGTIQTLGKDTVNSKRSRFDLPCIVSLRQL